MSFNADLPIRPGTVIDDKFRVEAVLGEGGMGVVVRALHLKLGAHVAIKFLLPEALADRIVVERFRREAQMSARLTSDNVARVLDVGNLSSGAPYMVMEYLQGETLGDLLTRKRYLAIHEACNYMMQVCEALTEAHSLGFVHRDLKPGNLFLVTRPNKTVVKLLDFGISKLGGMSAPATAGELTMTTMVLGTPSYMAPEQLISSRTVDTRADIWSCGVVMFRMLTGELPFDADSLIELGVKLMNNDPPDLRKLRPDVPTGLIAVVRKCLEREAHDRYQTAHDLSRALAPFAMEQSGGIPPQRPPTGSAPTLLADSHEIAAVAFGGSGSNPSVKAGAVPSSRWDAPVSSQAPPSSDEEARVTLPKLQVAQVGISAPQIVASSSASAKAAARAEVEASMKATVPSLQPPKPPPAPPTPQKQDAALVLPDTVPKGLTAPVQNALANVPPPTPMGGASNAWPHQQQVGDETRVASPEALHAIRNANAKVTPTPMHGGSGAFAIANQQQQQHMGSFPPPQQQRRPNWFATLMVLGVAALIIMIVLAIYLSKKYPAGGDGGRGVVTTATATAIATPTPTPTPTPSTPSARPSAGAKPPPKKPPHIPVPVPVPVPAN